MHVAVLVGQNLDLNVTRALDISLDVHRSVLKCREGFGLCSLKIRLQVRLPIGRSAFRVRRRLPLL